MKKIVTIATTMALALTGLSVIAGTQVASAVTPTTNLYSLNVANQGGGSGANQFVELGGKTYFVATTLARANAIWSVDGDITKEPVLIHDPFEGSTSGRISNMWGYDRYLFFWVQDTKINQYGNTLFGYNVETKAVKEVTYEDGTQMQYNSTDVGAVTESNGNVYALFKLQWGGQTTIKKVNPVNMTLTDMPTTPFSPRADGGGATFETTYNFGSPNIQAVGDYIYMLTSSTNYNRDDAEIYRLNVVTETWEGPLVKDGQQLRHLRLTGKVKYNGEVGALLSRATVIDTQSWWQRITNFETYFLRPNGDMLRLGTWLSNGGEVAPFNFKNDLYVVENGGALISKVDTVTGEKIDVLSTMFPTGAVNVNLRALNQVADKLVFGMNLDVQNQQSQFLLYSWDGVNAATRFTDVNPPVGQREYDVSHANSDGNYNYSIGGVGNYVIKVLHRDEKLGAEPYYIALDGTVTLMKDMNRSSDGSNPDTDCFISTSEGDWMTGNIPTQVPGGYGKDVIVSMQPVGTYLQYSIIDPGQIGNPCGFTFIGDDVFFIGYDQVTQEDSIFKRTPNGTITKMTELGDADDGETAFSYNGNYYWLADNRYENDLWMYEVATNTLIQLTGKDGDLIEEDDLYSAKLIGSKLYLSGEDSSTERDSLFVADLSNSEFSLTNLTAPLVEMYGGMEAEYLTDFNGKLIFSAEAEEDIDKVFEVDPETDEVREMFSLDEDTSYMGQVRGIYVLGKKIYLNFRNDSRDYELRMWTTGTSASLMPLPEEFELGCVAPVGTNIIVQDDNTGDAYFYGNGLNLTKIDYDFSGDTSAFCGASFTEHGSYLELPEYPYDGGAGFGTEPGYIGPLTPIAVSRLGEPVNEGPASPKGSTPLTDVAPVAPGTPGTPVATAAAGKVSLTWSAPTTGGAIASYIVESTPAGALCEITGTSAECIGLQEGTQYTFKVTAANESGVKSSSASNSVSPLPGGGPPGVVGTPVATGKDGGATITWTAPTTGGAVDSYIVRSNPSGANCVVTGLSANCTGLNNGDIYKFTVIAVNEMDISISSASSEIVIGDPATMAPSKPKKPLLTAGKLKITATVYPPTAAGVPSSYTVYLNGDNSYECTITAPAVSCVFEGLNPDYEYSANYVAINVNGSSENSDNSAGVYPFADVLPNTPSKPTLKAIAGGLNVKVAPPTSGGEALSYIVTLSPGGKTCEIIAPLTTCEITGLDPEVTYSSTVVARNNLGSSEASEASSEVKPLSNKPGRPSAPRMVAGPDKVTVTVTPPTTGGAVVSYLVTLSPGGKTCVITSPAVTCDVTGLDSSIAYTSTVIARNADGESVASTASTSATPLLPLPATPAAPTVVVGNAKATVTAAPALTGGAATSLKVTATPGGAFCVITLPATSCEITGLTNKTSYTFSTVATNASGNSAASVASAAAIPVDPNADVAPVEGDGGKAPKGIPSGGVKKFVATNDSSFQVAWDKKTGKLISRATGIYTGYIEAKITFTKAGKAHTCSAVFGVLKVMPQKTAAQKAAAMKMKTFTGKQFCIDKTKLNPATLAPKGGMTASNFKKIKPMNKSASELSKEKAAAAALKNFTGQVTIQVIRYRAWPTTMVNIGDHNSKGGKIPALVRNTKVTLG
jgi:hypothetical protein